MKWKDELEEKGSRMVKEIMAALPFLDNEVYVLYDLSLLCNTSVEDLKSRCANVLKGLLEIMNGEKEVVYKVSQIRDFMTLENCKTNLSFASMGFINGDMLRGWDDKKKK